MSPSPPTSMHAPNAAYGLFWVVFLVNSAATGGWLTWRARTTRSPLPLAAVGGGLAVGLVFPSIYDALTCVWFPGNIPGTFVTAFGMKDPLFDTIGYALFIGFGGWLLCEQLQRGRGARAIWGAFALWGVADLIIELPFLKWGMYAYYGDQPFAIGGFPLHWVFMNGLVPVLSGVGMYAVTEHWPFGVGRPWVRVAAMPALAGGLLLVPIAPVAIALHGDVPGWLREAAACLSIVTCCATLRWLTRLPHFERSTAAAARAHVPVATNV